MGKNPDCLSKVNDLLKVCRASQKMYGAGEMGAEGATLRTRAFHLILGDFPYWAVEKAFMSHLKNSPNFPSPSDIVKLVENDKEYLSVKINSSSFLPKHIEELKALAPPKTDEELEEERLEGQEVLRKLKKHIHFNLAGEDDEE